MKDKYVPQEGEYSPGTFPTAHQLACTSGLTKEGSLGQRYIKHQVPDTGGHALTLLRTKSSGVDPGPPPDGGLKAWTQVVAGHLVVFNCWGYINSFGLFQAYYATALGCSPSIISWVGSVQILLVFLIGAFSGRAMDAGYYRITLIVGSILQLLGVFMTSLSTKYWQLFLAQGICQGLGDGLMFCPTISLVATYFSTKRSLAISCAASGAATGGVVFPIIAQQLLPKIGFGWTVRVMGFVILANLAIIMVLARPRIPPRTTGPIIEWAAFKELPYVLFTIGMFLTLWGVYFAYYYVRCNPISFPEMLLTMIPGYSFRSRYYPRFSVHVHHSPPNFKRCWDSRAHHPSTISRPLFRRSQPPNSNRPLRRYLALLLGRRALSRRTDCLCDHLRVLWRWCPRPVPRHAFQLDDRPEENGS